ncbi:hypothetical protein L7F22_044391 [Adiantum nelumboides]|nr:hypothetical protein [Adiantum nelumboides]
MAMYSRLMYLPSQYLQTFEEAFVTRFFEIDAQIFHPMAKDLKDFWLETTELVSFRFRTVVRQHLCFLVRNSSSGYVSGLWSLVSSITDWFLVMLIRSLVSSVISSLVSSNTAKQAVLEPQEGEPKKQQVEEDEENLENIQADPSPPSLKSPPPASSPTSRPPPSPKSPSAPKSPPQQPSIEEVSAPPKSQVPEEFELQKEGSKMQLKDDKAPANALEHQEPDQGPKGVLEPHPPGPPQEKDTSDDVDALDFDLYVFDANLSNNHDDRDAYLKGLYDDDQSIFASSERVCYDDDQSIIASSERVCYDDDMEKEFDAIFVVHVESCEIEVQRYLNGSVKGEKIPPKYLINMHDTSNEVQLQTNKDSQEDSIEKGDMERMDLLDGVLEGFQVPCDKGSEQHPATYELI